MKKISFLGLVALFVTSLAWLVSCQNSNKTSKPDAKVELNIIGENSSTIQALMKLKEEYEAQNPNVILNFHPNTFDDAFNKSNQDFINGTGLYDIILQYNFSLSSFVGNNYVYPIDELLAKIPNVDLAFEKDLFPEAWKEVGYYYKDINNQAAGHVKVGYPFASNSMLVMYNKEMLENEENKLKFRKKYSKELEPPKTWENFKNIADFFTNPSDGTYGVCLAGGNGGFLYYDWMNFLYGFGGKIMDKTVGWYGDKESELFLSSPDAIKALEYYISLKPANKGNFTDVEQSLQMKHMKEGKTALAIVWSDMIYPNLNVNGEIDNRFGFEEIPGGKSVLAGGAFFINKKSKNAIEAAKFIMYVMKPDIQTKLARNGLSCPSMSSYSDIEVAKLPYSKPLFNSLKRGGVVLEAGPESSAISDIITTYVQRCWNNGETPESALTKAQMEIEQKRKEIYNSLSDK